MNPVTYPGHRGRIAVDPVAGTRHRDLDPRRARVDGCTLDQIEAVGIRYSTLIKRGTLRLLVKEQWWADNTDASPNAMGQAHTVPRGVVDDPIALAAALRSVGIPTVPLDGKDRPGSEAGSVGRRGRGLLELSRG